MRGHCEVGSGSSQGIPAGKGTTSESDDRANGFYAIAVVVTYMGCLALALVAAQLPEAVPAEIRAAAATLVLYLFPGLALERLLRPAGDTPLAVRIPMGIMFSLCGLYVTSLLVFIAHPTASVSIWLKIALSALPILGLLLASIRRRHTFTWRAARRSLKAWLVPAGVALLVFALVLVAVPQRYTHGRGWDSVYNLTIARKVAALPQLSFTSAFVSNDFVDPAYGYNPHLLSVGLIARWSHTDPAHAWAVLSLLLLVFYLLSVYSLAWRFLRSHPGALFVMAFGIATFFVHFFTVRSHCPVYANPSCLVRPAVLMAAFFLLPLLEEWSRPNALSFAFATATAASIHGSGGLLPAIYVGAFAGMAILFLRGQRRVDTVLRLGKTVLLLLVVAAPYLALKLVSGAEFQILSSLEQLQAYLPGVVEDVRVLSPSLYYLKPSMGAANLWLSDFWVLAALAVLSVPVLGRRVHLSMPSKLFMIGGFAGIALIVYLPFLMPLAARVFTIGQIIRLQEKNPLYLIYAWSVAFLLVKAVARLARRFRRAAIVGAVVGAMVLPIQATWPDLVRDFTESRAAVQRSEGSWEYPQYFDYRQELSSAPVAAMNERLEPGATIFGTVGREPHLILATQPVYLQGYLRSPSRGALNQPWSDWIEQTRRVEMFRTAVGAGAKLQCVREVGARFFTLESHDPNGVPTPEYEEFLEMTSVDLVTVTWRIALFEVCERPQADSP